MTRIEELELYLAVCDCRTRLAQGWPADEAAAASVRGRDVLADEVKQHALTAVEACVGERQRALEAARRRQRGLEEAWKRKRGEAARARLGLNPQS